MDALEEAAGDEVPFGDADEALWQQIAAAAQAELPGWDEFSGATFREFNHDPTGMQLMMSVGEISLGVPYWTAGDEAVRTVDTLRQLDYLFCEPINLPLHLIQYRRKVAWIFP